MLKALKTRVENFYSQAKVSIRSLLDFIKANLDKLIYLLATILASLGFILMKAKVRIYIIRTLLGFIFTYQISLLIGIIVGYVFAPSLG